MTLWLHKAITSLCAHTRVTVRTYALYPWSIIVFSYFAHHTTFVIDFTDVTIFSHVRIIYVMHMYHLAVMALPVRVLLSPHYKRHGVV